MYILCIFEYNIILHRTIRDSIFSLRVYIFLHVLISSKAEIVSMFVQLTELISNRVNETHDKRWVREVDSTEIQYILYSICLFKILK